MRETPLNSHPLNQIAKKLLEKVKVYPEPDSLYSLQLAQWMLETYPDLLPYPAQDYAWELEETAGVMLGWKPENAQGWLLTNPDDPLEAGMEIEARHLDKLNPKEAAARLCENLHATLSDVRPGLRPWTGLP